MTDQFSRDLELNTSVPNNSDYTPNYLNPAIYLTSLKIDNSIIKIKISIDFLL